MHEERLASPMQFATMLTRNIPGTVIPESRLIVAVLRQAAEDAQAEWRKFLRSYVPKSNAKDGKHQTPIAPGEFLRSATVRFWTSGGVSAYAELAGLDAVFVYEQFAKHMGIDLKATAQASAPEVQARLAESTHRVWALCTNVEQRRRRPATRASVARSTSKSTESASKPAGAEPGSVA